MPRICPLTGGRGLDFSAPLGAMAFPRQRYLVVRLAVQPRPRGVWGSPPAGGAGGWPPAQLVTRGWAGSIGQFELESHRLEVRNRS